MLYHSGSCSPRTSSDALRRCSSPFSVPKEGGIFSVAAGSYFFTLSFPPPPFKAFSHPPGELSRLGLPVIWASPSNRAVVPVPYSPSHVAILNPFCEPSWDLLTVVLDADENNVEKNAQRALCPRLQVRALCFDHFTYCARILKW